MKYTIEKIENGYICLVGGMDGKPKVYVFKKKHRVIEWLDADLQ